MNPDERIFYSGLSMGNEAWVIRPNLQGDYILPASSSRGEHQAVALLRIDDAGHILHAANPAPTTEPEKFACMFFGIVSKGKWMRRPRV